MSGNQSIEVEILTENPSITSTVVSRTPQVQVDMDMAAVKVPRIEKTTEILKGDNDGNAIAATPNEDYQTPLVAGTDYQTPLTAGTDYWQPPVLVTLSNGADNVYTSSLSDAEITALAMQKRFVYVAGSDRAAALLIPLVSIGYNPDPMQNIGVQFATTIQNGSWATVFTVHVIGTNAYVFEQIVESRIEIDGILKGRSDGGITAAIAGFDYQTPLVAGTDYQTPLPSQSGNNGKFLTTNGSAMSWGAAYVKPANGIPKSDLDSAVQTSLGKADTALQSAPVTSVNSATGDVVITAAGLGAYEKPNGGIPKTDLDSGVQTSLGKADTALQSAPVTSVNTQTGDVVITAAGLGAYEKPAGGIPASDLDSSVQTSLGKADTALQSAPVTSVNTKTGAVSLDATDVGALPSGTAVDTVKQNYPDPTSYSYWRPLVIGKSAVSGATDPFAEQTDEVYTFSAIRAQPSTGTVKASVFDGTATLAVRIPYGEVDSTSVNTAFTATVDGITELKNGVCCYIRNDVVAGTTGLTLNVNGLGAKPVYASNADATRTTSGWSAAITLLLVYNENRVSGGCWDGYYGIPNSNSIGYQIRTNSATLKVKTYCGRYRLLFKSPDGEYFVPANADSQTSAAKTHTVTTEKIDPFGGIRYYASTSVLSANAAVGVAVAWQQYNGTLGYSFNNTNAALTLTTSKPVYIVCTPNTDGSANIDANTPYTQDLPTTNDGKIYIYLGIASSATAVEVEVTHPVYYHNGTGIRIWTGQ